MFLGLLLGAIFESSSPSFFFSQLFESQILDATSTVTFKIIPVEGEFLILLNRRPSFKFLNSNVCLSIPQVIGAEGSAQTEQYHIKPRNRTNLSTAGSALCFSGVPTISPCTRSPSFSLAPESFRMISVPGCRSSPSDTRRMSEFAHLASVNLHGHDRASQQ